MEGQPFPRHCRAHHRPQWRTACVHIHKRQRRNGDDVMNHFLRRVGYNGRLFFCFQKIEKFIKKWYNKRIKCLRRHPVGIRTFFHKIKMGFVRAGESSIPYVNEAKRYGNYGEDEFTYMLRRELPSCKIKRNIIISKFNIFITIFFKLYKLRKWY